MDAIGNVDPIGAVAYIIDALLGLIVWVVIAYAIMSWLVSFDIVNLRNRTVYRVSRFLEAVVNPLLRPFRRFLPTLGGLDFSPVVLIILISAARIFLLKPLLLSHNR